MKFIHRLGYYLGGFAIGLIFLAFFLSGKKTSCAYGPEARVLKNISTKPLRITDEVRDKLELYQIDSTALANSLRTGNVVFKRSETKREPCGRYLIEDEINTEAFEFIVENCDSLAMLYDVIKKQ